MRFAGSDFAPIFWLVVAAGLLLTPLPAWPSAGHWPALLDEIQNLLHFPLFAALASVGFRALRARFPRPDRRPYAFVMIAALLFALLTEGLQVLVGREPAWLDLALDLLGAAFALLLHARAECRLAGPGQRSRVMLLVAATVIGLLAVAPLGWTAAAYAYRASQKPVMWRADSLLLARFSHWQGGAYPGLAIDEPPVDWRDWSYLEVRSRNPGELPVTVVVRVHDRKHDLSHHDRYNGSFVLEPASVQTLRVSLEEIRTAPAGRAMDLGAIQGLIIYGLEPAGQARGFDVLEIRLGR